MLIWKGLLLVDAMDGGTGGDIALSDNAFSWFGWLLFSRYLLISSVFAFSIAILPLYIKSNIHEINKCRFSLNT